jgi:hypothetical protein
MDRIIWLFLAFVAVLAALVVVLAGIRARPRSVENNPGHCSNCETPMSLRPVSVLKSHALLGGWECPHCGSKMSKRGRVAGTAS